MTKDVVTLTKKMPDPLSVLAGLLSGGPDRLVGAEGEGAVVQLCDTQGRPLVSVEAPLLVQVRGEAERLLGASAPEVPYWWTEARATTGVKEAEQLAGTFAARLATLVGGTAWPPEVAWSLAVVNTDGMSAAPVPAAAQPAVDVLTDKVAVIIQDRPVVAMTAWLADAFRAAANAELGLQIVTPAGTRLSPAVRNSLPGWPSRWVVQDERDGYYDGLSGAVLEWNNGLFVTVESPDATPQDPRTPMAATFGEGVQDTGERQLALSFRTVHPADDRLVLGGAVESVWREITGEPPAGWGTEEPANLPWSLRQLTDVAYERSPAPTWLVVVGTPERPGIATVRITRTKGGVEEDVTMAFGYGPGEQLPTDAVQAAAEALATRHDLQSMLVQIRRARRDLSVPPRFEGPGVPYAFVLGAEEVRTMPGDRARRTPLAQSPRELGPKTRPALYYPLPGDPSDLSGWQDFERLMRHLKGD
ncbi:DUF6177 family protein [Streptomyces resistomycificus]|uniref:Uncharacterized protein n=1 Tax=Streptomyces resistomycificus TaxID=67356 RepID=A0A0L8LRG8_9ACTN|nr:DUF6177 family protein [Streptomyces resistomycificus]KOG40721.1 hypothetical protein ADK37_07120 [Streptomyces resistomycificus]KUN99317.1 hypothetical protein AQJ84_12950 [Streptomyces resistomycificus]